MTKKINKLIFFLLATLPFPLFADVDFNLAGSQFKDVLAYIRTDLINPLFFVLEGLAFIIFFYGLIKFVIKADSEEELKKGKNYMMWGIIALFVMVTFSTIIGLLSNEFGFGKTPIIPIIQPK